MQKVLVTGASGVLGRAIVQAAVGTGLAVRQGVRNSSKANPAVESTHLDYGDPLTITAALEGFRRWY